VDLLDLAIIVLCIGYSVSGYRRGLSWVGASLVGLFVGILLGAWLGPLIAHKFVPAGTTHSQVRAAVATGLFLFFVFTLQGIGAMIGLRARLKVMRSSYVHWDSAAGSALGLLGVIVSSWYVGLTFANSPFAFLDQQIQKSAIVKALYNIAPTVPRPVAALNRILTSPDNFSGAFSNLNSNVQIPSNVDTAGVAAAAANTYKVVSTITSSDCAGIESGSGWPINSNHIVTNAHVVAGGSHVDVQSPSGDSLAGQVVFFDPNIDIAVVYVPDANYKPMHLVSSDPAPAVIGAVIGYPGGGPEQVSPAAVKGTESARSQDIYSSNDVVRMIEVLASRIVPGNSGGPVVDESGNVIGVVFAASTTNVDSEGYALAPSQVQSDLSAGARQTSPVSTQACVSS
jgi:S1-C subfamily serine protease